jgi:hypothetical protein
MTRWLASAHVVEDGYTTEAGLKSRMEAQGPGCDPSRPSPKAILFYLQLESSERVSVR